MTNIIRCGNTAHVPGMNLGGLLKHKGKDNIMKTPVQVMRTIYLFTSLLFISVFFQPLNAQNPLEKQWDHSYGGYDGDFIYELLATSDSGFIAAGESLSNMLYEKSEDTDFYSVSYYKINL